MTSRVSLLLVHGAHHGAWCWEPVLARLSEHGIPAQAVDLPLDGYSSDVATVRSAVQELRADGPVAVVAHSYAGIVVAAAAHAASRLIFVAARLPLPGESQAALHWNLPGLREATSVDGDGWAHLGPAARDFFYSDCPSHAADLATSRLRPMRSVVPTDPLEMPAWTTVPTAYIVCRRDKVVRVDRQRERAALVDDAYELDCGHSPFFALPDELTGLLMVQAAKTATHSM
ncbi:alpha/beta fold hydrolase [Streptomyces sp. NBC_01217]|uniref:alpha/beta fold hydrolase n=1 Tax=Streptomyces sp. NBC_01217 TaxID=2903779 RepID=UPI002E0ECCB6|nr:alpha/beta fold hydrolase [Streptomyces sp. NBC_01217]